MSDQEKTPEETTPVAGFKKQIRSGALCELPSGNHVRIRNPGMEVFLQKGLIPDSLTPIVRAAVNQGKQPDMEELSSGLLEDKEKLREVFELFNSVVIETWVDPSVLPAPKSEDDRDPEKLYTDEIEFNDKVFTFQFAVGGVKNLETFRNQQEEVLASIPTG